MKYIVVTGGVVSGLGKGITISSIGRILKAGGVRVTSIKIDPYLNVDAGIIITITIIIVSTIIMIVIITIIITTFAMIIIMILYLY